MLISKSKRVLFVALMALAGAGYFGAFSGLDVHPVFKNELVLLPVQVGALIYLLWWRKEQKENRS